MLQTPLCPLLGISVPIIQGALGGPSQPSVRLAAVAPVPVVAASGIAHGRGLAEAVALGAQGANVGNRFIASEEAELSEGYKRAVSLPDPTGRWGPSFRTTSGPRLRKGPTRPRRG